MTVRERGDTVKEQNANKPPDPVNPVNRVNEALNFEQEEEVINLVD